MVEWTVIRPLWLNVFMMKILLLLILGLSSLLLKSFGLHTVVQDEQGLSSLLRTAIEERAWPEQRKSGLGDGIIFLNACETADGALDTLIFNREWKRGETCNCTV